MPSKLSTLYLFMTREDEDNFSKNLIEAIPDIIFIDNHPWKTPEPAIRQSLADCYEKLNSGAVILNNKITTLADYKDNYIGSVRNGTEFHGSPVGEGLIQFEHSKNANYLPDGLRDGGLAASYDSDSDPETDQFVKAVWKIAKKHAFKLYALDPKTGLILHDKPSTKFFAWPDAVAKYDQVDGLFLTNNTMAYFTSKKP
ncbi:hypothetical protein [Chitinilyticum litopenaei]|uniref:hypothetical protein n=1 Tax=Chitinilyticum litopenaei TaxID=1121276 RepID=UPI0011860E38|nr:hypothetical protein [Chitinilyticum litopenaei]